MINNFLPKILPLTR